MKHCITCNKELTNEDNFCQNCGADQRVVLSQVKNNGSTIFLYILCTLTILGSLFGIARGWLYEMVSGLDHGSDYVRGWIYIITNIGTLAAAIIMINKKKPGLYVYTVAQGLYILTVMAATVSYSDTFDGSDALALGISALFLIPAIAFLIFYWLNVNRKHLS